MLMILLFGCTKYDEAQIYVIPEGGHYSKGRKISRVKDNEIYFHFTFNETHRYIAELPDGTAVDFQNKLYGLTALNPEKHSARISWMQVGDRFLILAFYHINGIWDSEPLYYAEIDEELDLVITAGYGIYRFYCNGTEYILHGTPKFKPYRAYPYFGGDPVCPHKMTFIIEEF